MLPEYQTELNQPRTNELVVNAKNHCRFVMLCFNMTFDKLG